MMRSIHFLGDQIYNSQHYHMTIDQREAEALKAMLKPSRR